MVLIFTESSNCSQRVLDEVNLVINCGKPIIPFRVEDLEPTGAIELHLSTRHWLDAYHPNWKANLDRLVESVEANLELDTVREAAIKPPADVSSAEPAGSKWLANVNQKLISRLMIGAAGLVVLSGLGYLVWNGLGSRLVSPAGRSTITVISTPTQITIPTQSINPPPEYTNTPATSEAPETILDVVVSYIEDQEPTFLMWSPVV